MSVIDFEAFAAGLLLSLNVTPPRRQLSVVAEALRAVALEAGDACLRYDSGRPHDCAQCGGDGGRHLDCARCGGTGVADAATVLGIERPR